MLYRIPRCSCGKGPTYQRRRHKRPRFDPWVKKIPWRRAWQLTPVFLPGEFHGQRSLAGYIQSMRWQRVEHDRNDLAHTQIHTLCFNDNIKPNDNWDKLVSDFALEIFVVVFVVQGLPLALYYLRPI